MANGDDGSEAKSAILELTGIIDGLRGAVNALTQPFEEAAQATNKFVGELGATSGFKGFKDLALELIDLSAELQQATGQGEKFANMATGVAGQLKNLGVATSDAANAAKGLFATYSNFSLLAPKTQRALVKQAAAMEKLGISTQTTAQSQEILIKAMGMTQNQAIATNEELASFALAIGEAPAKMAQDFVQAGPKLAKYGKSGIRVFKQLAAQSKATGVQMGKLLAMTERFDTFEGAAQAAGNLNAILGGPLLNSVQLLTANEAERVNMIRQAVNATGRSFESMNRFEKQAIAQAAGIGDVADAVRLFGTEQAMIEDLEEKVDPSVKAQQELTKALQAGVKIADKFRAAFEQLSMRVSQALKPLLKDIIEFITGDEGLGATEGIFDNFASGLRKGIKFLKQYKEPIKTIGSLVIKVGALGFAFSQAGRLIDPVLAAISNPWVLIGAGILYVIKHWEAFSAILSGDFTLIKGLFTTLDEDIMGLFGEYEEKFPLVKAMKKAYVWVKKKLPEAFAFLKEKYDEHIAPFVTKFMEQFNNQTGFFEGGFEGVIDRSINEMKSIFNDISEILGGLYDAVKGTANIIRTYKERGVSGVIGDAVFGTDEEIKARLRKSPRMQARLKMMGVRAEASVNPVTPTERNAAMSFGPPEQAYAHQNQTPVVGVLRLADGTNLGEFQLDFMNRETDPTVFK